MNDEQVPGLRAWQHFYTSTACRHHPWVKDGRCRETCKFCGSMCRCWCHTPGIWHPFKWVRYVLRVGFNGMFGRRQHWVDPYD